MIYSADRFLFVHQRNYKITSSGACERTEAAARMKHTPLRQWRDQILGRSKAGEPRRTKKVLQEWVEVYLQESKINIAALEETLKMHGTTPPNHEIDRLRISLRRWRQIETLCEDALKAVHG